MNVAIPLIQILLLHGENFPGRWLLAIASACRFWPMLMPMLPTTCMTMPSA